MENAYAQLVYNLEILSSASSSRALEAEEYLQSQTQNNPQLHYLLRQVIIDPNIKQTVKLMSATSLNNHLINMIAENPYDEIFSFTRQLVRDVNFSKLQQLNRFMVEFITRADEKFVQDWLMLYKQLLQHNLTLRAINILSFFSVAQMSNNDFVYFINMAVPWVVEHIGQKATIENSMIVLEWSKAMCQILNKLLEKEDEVFRENLIIIAENSSIARLIVSAYELESEQENGYLCTKQNLQQLNIFKGSICQMHSLTLQVYKKNCKPIRDTVSWSLLIETVPRLSISVLLIAKNFDLYNQALHSSNFTKYILKVFSNALHTTECQTIFSVFSPKLISEVIIPAFVFTEIQQISFQENNQEFILCVEDIINRHQSETLKSCAAQLLQQLADWIPGALTDVINLAVYSIKVNLNIISKQPNQFLMNNCQSLIIIGVLGYCSQVRQDIAKLIGQLLSYNSEVILKTFSPIELAVLYIVLEYTGDQFQFPEGDYGYVYLKYASICKVHPTTEFAALTFLSSKIKSVNSIEILKILIERTQNCGYGLIWSILQNFVKNNLSILPQEVAIDLVNVILCQIQRLRNSKEDTVNYNTMQCINILKQLCCTKNKFLKSKGDLRSAIFKVFQLFKIEQWANADDLIQLLNDFVKGRKKVDDLVYDLIPDINLRLLENEDLYLNLFEFINVLILKGEFVVGDQRLLIVLEWCLRPLGFDRYKECERAESLLLVQLLLDKYMDCLTPHTIIQTLSILNQYNLKLNQPPAHLRLLVTNILFYNAPIDFPKLDLVKKALSVKFSMQGYSSVYTKKLLVIFLFKIMFAQTQIQILSFVLGSIINLLCNWNIKAVVRSKVLKKQIEAYNLQQYKNSVHKLVSPYKKIDIFQFFAVRIESMKNNNHEVFEQIIAPFSEQTKNNFKKVLSLRQVNKQQTVPRAIYKIKGAKQEVVFVPKQQKQKEQMESENQDDQKDMDVQDDQKQYDIKIKKQQKNENKKRKIEKS